MTSMWRAFGSFGGFCRYALRANVFKVRPKKRATNRAVKIAARAGFPRSAMTPTRGASSGSAPPGFLRYFARKKKNMTKTAPPTITAAMIYNENNDCHCSAEGARAGTGTGYPHPPKKGALWIVVAIVIAVALTAAVMDVVVFPTLTPTQSAVFKVHLMTFDVGYDAPNFNPEWRVKTGQLVVVTMNNSGTMDHEFLLFAGSRAAILATVKSALALAESHNPGYLTNEAIGNDRRRVHWVP